MQRSSTAKIGTEAAPVALLRLADIHKSYSPNVQALRGVSLEFRAGEVVALLGANGAGKSTLARIATGVELPTRGNLYLDGRPVNFSGPSAALQKGIAAIYQELPLLPNLTAAENMSLGHTGQSLLAVWRSRPSRSKYVALAKEIPDAPPPEVVVGRLSVAQRQKVAFVRALSMEPRLLIVDEGTSSVALGERREMQELLRRLAHTRGIAVITISHFIDDALSGADRIVVLRDGLVGLDRPVAETRHNEVLAVLSGAAALPSSPVRASVKADEAASSVPASAAGLAVDALACEGVRPLSFSVNAGECVGLYGPPGCGATETLRAIAGLTRHTGTILWNGAGLPRSMAERVLRNVAYCNGDRGKNLILRWTVGRNIGLPYLFRDRQLAIPSRRAENERASDIIARFAIKGSAGEAIQNLSGGNQQRVAVARTVSIGAPLLLLGDDLTRGVDVVGRAHIHGLLRSAKREGAAVLLYSSDPEELAELCDRVLVLRDGAVIREVGGHEVTVAMLEGEVQRRRHG
jgi:ABC-type sugar transport system ATPase subunit